MDYFWAYIGNQLQGPMEMTELERIPGFNKDTPLCPASSRITSAQEVNSIRNYLARFQANRQGTTERELVSVLRADGRTLKLWANPNAVKYEPSELPETSGLETQPVFAFAAVGLLVLGSFLYWPTRTELKLSSGSAPLEISVTPMTLARLAAVRPTTFLIAAAKQKPKTIDGKRRSTRKTVPALASLQRRAPNLDILHPSATQKFFQLLDEESTDSDVASRPFPDR